MTAHDHSTHASWLMILGEPATPTHLHELRQRAVARFDKKGFTSDDERYIATLNRQLTGLHEQLSDTRLELFRRLCATWHVTLTPPEISSHRPYIGPVIVFGKRLLYRLLTPLLSRYLRDEREFRAAVVGLFADLLAKSDERKAG